jgi:DNA-binding response OmpR family regulator
VVVLVKLSEETEAFSGFEAGAADTSATALDGGTAELPPLHAVKIKDPRATKRTRDFTRATLLPRRREKLRTCAIVQRDAQDVPLPKRSHYTDYVLALRDGFEVYGYTRRNSSSVDSRAQPTILAITDDPTLQQVVNWLLHERDFVVRVAGIDADLSLLRVAEPNAILLDVSPTVAHAAVTTKRLREAFREPIITLGTNESPYEIEYLRGAGADDHLIARERWTLVQCIRGHLRMLPTTGRVVKRFPVLELDETRMQAILRGLPIELSPIEYALLTRLMRRPYCIVSTTELLHEVRQHHQAVAAQTLRASIHHLRRKVEDDPHRPQRLMTVLGSGYVFRPDV